MALRKPLVQVNGQVQQLQSGDSLDAPTTSAVQLTLTNADSVSVVVGAPVYIFGNTSFKRAQANAAATATVIGLVAAAPSIAAAAAGAVALGGPLVATTAQWDAVTGQTGGLTAGAKYYLSATTPGLLTTTAPTTGGQYVAAVGVAIDTITMNIDTDQTILL